VATQSNQFDIKLFRRSVRDNLVLTWNATWREVKEAV